MKKEEFNRGLILDLYSSRLSSLCTFGLCIIGTSQLSCNTEHFKRLIFLYRKSKKFGVPRTLADYIFAFPEFFNLPIVKFFTSTLCCI
jgi:hypothetical protein